MSMDIYTAIQYGDLPAALARVTLPPTAGRYEIILPPAYDQIEPTLTCALPVPLVGRYERVTEKPRRKT